MQVPAGKVGIRTVRCPKCSQGLGVAFLERSDEGLGIRSSGGLILGAALGLLRLSP
jgi:hypothetical protein